MLAVGTVPAKPPDRPGDVGGGAKPAGFRDHRCRVRTSVAGIWAAGDVTGPPLLGAGRELEARVAWRTCSLAGTAPSIITARRMAVFIDPGYSPWSGRPRRRACSLGTCRGPEGSFDLRRWPRPMSSVPRSGGCCSGRWSTAGARRADPRPRGLPDLIHEVALAVRACLTGE